MTSWISAAMRMLPAVHRAFLIKLTTALRIEANRKYLMVIPSFHECGEVIRWRCNTKLSLASWQETTLTEAKSTALGHRQPFLVLWPERFLLISYVANRILGD